MSSGTYSFNKGSTESERDSAINKLIIQYDNSKNGTQESDVKKTKPNRSFSFMFMFICEALVLLLIMGSFFENIRLHSTGFITTIFTLIGLYGLLLAFNIVLFVSIRTPNELNMSRIAIETTKTFPIIFIVLLSLLVMPRLIDVFANTIGYSIISLPYLSNLTNVMSNFKSKAFSNPEKYNCKIPFNWLITTFPLNKYDEIINQMSSEGIDFNIPKLSNENDETYTKRLADIKSDINKLVERKHRIGHMMWIYLATVTASLFSTLELIK